MPEVINEFGGTEETKLSHPGKGIGMVAVFFAGALLILGLMAFIASRIL